jgi:hypothetical protein
MAATPLQIAISGSYGGINLGDEANPSFHSGQPPFSIRLSSPQPTSRTQTCVTAPPGTDGRT